VDHYGQVERRGSLLGASQSLEIICAGNVVRQARLDADDDIAIASNGALRRGHVSASDVVQLAARHNPCARNVNERASKPRRSTRDFSDMVNIVRATRTRIDRAGHAILQAQRRSFLASPCVRLDVSRRPKAPPSAIPLPPADTASQGKPRSRDGRGRAA